MNKKLRFFVTLIIILVFGMTVLGCNEKSALVGRWTLKEGPTYNNPEEMVLFKDGTGIVDGAGITWNIDNHYLYITHPLGSASWYYDVSSSRLTLSDSSGKGGILLEGGRMNTFLHYQKN